jgi:hypothetical protein
MSEWLSYLSGVGLALRGIFEVIPAWIWLGVIGLFVMARVGGRIAREVSRLGQSLENLEVQIGEIHEQIRLIGRTLRLRPDAPRAAQDEEVRSARTAT